LEITKQIIDIIDKEISERLGISQKDLSDQKIENYLGIKAHRIRAWRGGQRPSADDLETLSRKLGFSPRWLLLGEGSIRETMNPDDEPKPATPLESELLTLEKILRRANASDEEIRRNVAELLRRSPKRPGSAQYPDSGELAVSESHPAVHEGKEVFRSKD